MTTIVTRASKGSELTHNEMDANFDNLNNDKAEKASAISDKNENYTLVLTDAGKTIRHTAADSTTRTYTIPLEASVNFTVGTIIKFINLDDNNVTITASGAAVLYWLDGTDSAVADADRTLGRRGSCIIQKTGSDEWIIEGNAGLY